MKWQFIPIITLLLLFFGQTTVAQKISPMDSLICKDWKLDHYEADGEKIPPAAGEEGNRMIFYRNHKVTSIEPGKQREGVWRYDEAKKILTITDDQTAEKMILGVISITPDKWILELKDKDSPPVKIHMIPATKE